MIDRQTDAMFEDIQNWFFQKYLPTWIAIGVGSHPDPRKVLDYWGVPMHAASPNLNRWFSTEEEVLGLLSAVQTPLKEQQYSHTNALDRLVTLYNDAAASVDVIWSRRNADDAEIDRTAVHFEIRAVHGYWRIISVVSIPTDKEWLTDVFRY
jgi:hypothetical protein